VEAHKMIKRMKIDSQKARKIIDKIAASIILEDYLENLKK
jgi:RNase H-fold protein (predicted Holliday junction resolvase)